ncbi:MAG: SAM-dependent methyltransferase [Bacteroidales bacterium]|nr:SAM-dependent methyltransferase [Bacteroidales bacterium]MBO7568138.1 SAM-dependent methyltransferase [Bacteroidales bacterium]MBP5682065.1 SAM-dependent methyltransferase [Bacteroidales bacterium]
MDKVLTEFIDKLRSAIKKRTYVKLLLTKRVLGNQDLNKIVVRYVELSGKPNLQFVYKYDRNDEAKNFTIEDGIVQLQSIIGNNFLDNILYTTKEDLNLRYNNKNEGKIIKTKPTFTEAADGSHDEAKKRLLNTKKSVYFKSLGITDQKGEIIPSMNAKYKQVEKFVEIIDTLADNVKDCSPVKIADMGCGKGYLTFATYDYLTNTRELTVDMKGVETQENLVKFCNNIAQKATFGGLEFVQSNINDFKADKLDMLIALHACDTATDDAIYLGMQANAKLIIVSPCCHKQIRQQMKITSSNVLEPALKYGIVMERMAELLTDSLRVLILNKNGYKTKLFEFIEPEFTSKNNIITAEKGEMPSAEEQGKIQAQIDAIKNKFGIKFHYLEKLIENPTDQSWRVLNAQCAKSE